MKRTLLLILISCLIVSPCVAEEIDVFWLSEKGTLAQLQDALKNGAKFNVTDDETGETPLHRAATSNKNPESIKFLIEQGIDVNASKMETYGASNADYDTPLSLAIRNRNIEAVKELLKAGADPKITSKGYSASLEDNILGNAFQIVAAEYRNDYSNAKAIIKALVEASADVNDHDDVDKDIQKIISDSLKEENANSILLPNSQWNSSIPINNLIALSKIGEEYFKLSCAPLIYAVLYDNPDVVNILLDVSADANIKSAEGKTALDYANELPDSSELKKSPAFEKLKAATTEKKSANTSLEIPAYGIVTADKPAVYNLPIKESGISWFYSEEEAEAYGRKIEKSSQVTVIEAFVTPDDGTLWYKLLNDADAEAWILAKDVQLTNKVTDNEYLSNYKPLMTNELYLKKKAEISNAEDENFERADKLVAEGTIPMYVRDKGKFIYNSEFDIVGINAQKVNLRSQPNTKANVVAQLSRSDTGRYPVYLGEWTHPNGEHWVLGEYHKNGLGNGKGTPVWIFGKYADPMTEEMYGIAAEGIAMEEAEKEREIIEAVRNNMYYSDFSPELGYGPVGRQLERYYGNPEWSIETTNSKDFEKNIAVFSGIARDAITKRRRKIVVRFARAVQDTYRFKKGNLVLTQIDLGGEVIYRYFMSKSSSREPNAITELRGFAALLATTFGGDGSPNKISLTDFLELIYSID